MQGKEQCEARALAQSFAVRFHPAAVQGHDAAHQCQAQAQPALRALRAAFGLPEQVEHVRQQFGVDAHAVILHLDHDLVAAHVRAERDRPAGGGVLRRVVQQVADHLDQAHAVAADADVRAAHIDLQRVAMGLDQGLGLLDSASHDGAELRLVSLDRHQPARDARDVEQVVDQGLQVVDLADDHLAGAPHDPLVGDLQAQGLGGGGNRGQRIAQLVRQHRQEFILGVVLVFRLAPRLALAGQQGLALGLQLPARLVLVRQLHAGVVQGAL